MSFKKLPEFGKTFYVFHDSAAFSFFEIEKKAHKIEAHQKQQKSYETLCDCPVVWLKTEVRGDSHGVGFCVG